VDSKNDLKVTYYVEQQAALPHVYLRAPPQVPSGDVDAITAVEDATAAELALDGATMTELALLLDATAITELALLEDGATTALDFVLDTTATTELTLVEEATTDDDFDGEATTDEDLADELTLATFEEAVEEAVIDEETLVDEEILVDEETLLLVGEAEAEELETARYATNSQCLPTTIFAIELTIEGICSGGTIPVIN
jgi:hypothetical protein